MSHQILDRVTFLCIVASSSGSRTDQFEVNLISSKWLTLLTFKIFHLGVCADTFYGRAEQFTLLTVIVSSCLHLDLHSFHILKIFVATVSMRDLIIHWNSSAQKNDTANSKIRKIMMQLMQLQNCVVYRAMEIH